MDPAHGNGGNAFAPETASVRNVGSVFASSA